MVYSDTILVKSLVKYIGYCGIFCCLCACRAGSTTGTVKVHIVLSKDSQAIVVTKLDYAILHDLKNDSLTYNTWTSIFPVYHMPADTDMIDFVKELPGQYTVNDTAIVFKPDTPFIKHQNYFARFYQEGMLKSQLQMVQSKANLNGPKFQQVTFGF